MTKKSVGGTLISVGGGLIAIVRVREQLKPHLVLSGEVASSLLAAGVVLLVLGVLVIMASAIAEVTASGWRWVASKVSDAPRYSCRAAKEAELQVIHEFWAEFFPSDLSDVSEDRAWHRRNGQTSWCVFEVTDSAGRRHDKPKLIGSFGLLPLTKKATALLAAGGLRPPHFLAEHIAKAGSRPSAVYLGGVAARGWRGKGETLARLCERIKALRGKGTPVYTRPVSEDGMRLVKKFEFESVFPERTGMKELYRLLNDPDE